MHVYVHIAIDSSIRALFTERENGERVLSTYYYVQANWFSLSSGDRPLCGHLFTMYVPISGTAVVGLGVFGSFGQGIA